MFGRVNSFLDKVQGVEYKRAFVWEWDGKVHSGEVIWYGGVGQPSVFARTDYVVNSGDNFNPVQDPPVWILQRRERWFAKLQSGVKIPLPSECVTQKVIGTVLYNVCEILSVWKIKEDGMIRDVVGCLGTGVKPGKIAIFGVDLSDFKLLPGMYVETWDDFLEEEKLPTCPAFSPPEPMVPKKAPPFEVTHTSSFSPASLVQAEDQIKLKQEVLDESYRPGSPFYGRLGDDETFEKDATQDQKDKYIAGVKLMEQFERLKGDQVKETYIKDGRICQEVKTYSHVNYQHEAEEKCLALRKKWKQEGDFKDENFCPLAVAIPQEKQEEKVVVGNFPWIKGKIIIPVYTDGEVKARPVTKQVKAMTFPDRWEDVKVEFSDETGS